MKPLRLKPMILLAAALLFTTGTVLAQQENDNKTVKNEIVIIKKIKDENGNVQVQKIVKSADSGEVIIEKTEGSEDIEVFELDVTNDFHTLDLQDLEGLSEELKEKLKNIEVDIDDDGIERRIKVIMSKSGEDGEIENFEWEGLDDFPEDLKLKMEENGFMWQGSPHDEFHGYSFGGDSPNGNKACLGVMIGKTVEVENGTETVRGESDQGVTVLDIIDNSGAQEAGLLKDDIITAIEGQNVASIQDVLDVLKPYEGGESVTVEYLRNNQPAQVTATLKTCENKMKIKRFDTLDGDHDEVNEFVFDENENSEKKVIIIKKKMTIETPTGESSQEGVNESEIDTPGNTVVTGVSKPATLELQTISIFPNPTSGVLNLEFTSDALPTTVKVFDISGKEIYNEELKDFDGSYKNEINLGQVSKGTLMVTITQNGKIYTEKITAQ
jgi:hypothetical protein